MSADVNVTEKVREALRRNLRDTTGDCVCDPAYTERRLIDPHCGWHEAEGTTDDDSAARVLSVLHRPDVQAGIAEVLAHHYAVDFDASTDVWFCVGCNADIGDAEEDDGTVAHGLHQAAAVVEWITGRQG